MEATLAKMASFSKRTILFVDTLRDTTNVVERMKELGLKAHVVHSVSEVVDKEKCPHIDTIVVDTLSTVSVVHGFLFYFIHNNPRVCVSQTESVRELEHLRYIPIVLLAPRMPRLNRTSFFDPLPATPQFNHPSL